MREPRTLPRWSLAFVSGASAVVFGWGAWMLPWRAWTTFAVATMIVAAMHAATAALAAIDHRARGDLWRVQAIVALAYLGYLTWNLLVSAAYIAELYGGLGQGVAVALGLVWLIVAALIVPLSAWGLAVTGGVQWAGRTKAGVALATVFVTLGLWRARDAGAADPLLGSPAPDVTTMMEQAVPTAAELRLPEQGGDTSLMTGEAAACDAPVGPDRVTILTTYRTPGVAGRPEVTTRCLQASSLEHAGERLYALLRSDAVRGRIKIDVVTASLPLQNIVPVVDSLGLRPGLDGVCEGARCLAPWQLVALDLFTSTAPIPVVPELRFGFDPLAIRKALAPADRRGPIPSGLGGLVRIETHSLVTDDTGQVHRLRRLRPPGPALDAASLDRGLAAAERYLLSAQGPDGRFEYRIDPFTGLVSHRGFSLARQAGTTLVVCELARARTRAREVATSALQMLESVQRVHGELAALYYPVEKDVRFIGLGDTALSAIAFLSCRDLVGDRFDDTIDRLVRFLRTMQRTDGSFHPKFDLLEGATVPGPDPLYAVGQAVFALTLYEKLVSEPSNTRFEDLGVRDAVEAAMDYTADDYWNVFARDFFFMEENWHCLAARASLGHHRHDRYERFCLDYVRYKTRLILEETDGVDPDLVGGYGVGNVLLPHNTGSSGFGEAMAAAMAIMQARGDDPGHAAEKMRLVLGFLLHHQWDDLSCFACNGPHPIAGGFSEHMGSPHIRIDYVQHAMAAMGHGGRMLGLLDATRD